MNQRLRLAFAFFALVAVTLACGFKTNPGEGDANPPQAGAATKTPDYSGECANVLYPFLPGRQWIYQKSASGQEDATPGALQAQFGLTVDEVSDSRASVTTVDLAAGTTTQATVECREGAITNFPLMVITSLFGDYLAGGIRSEYVSGIYAPSKAELDAADWDMEWEGEYLTSGTLAFTEAGETTTITLEESPTTLLWQNDGQERVTVPAGTFENAYRVTCRLQVQALLSLEGISGMGTLTFNTIHWFEPYTGLLKMEIDSASLTLLGITFPLEVSGEVELVEMH